MHAIVRVGLVPVRAKPSVRAEQVSQEVLGAVLEILERQDEWARVRGEDGYEGWVGVGGLIGCDAERAAAWRADPSGDLAVSLDAVVENGDGGVLTRLPWGARVRVDGALATLPDGTSGRLIEGRWLLADEVAKRFPREASATVKTAREWMGVPYVWGGRTLWGADCSGLVQAIYLLHGFALPRDSYQQARVGEPLEPGRDFATLEPGDLIFFRAEDSEHIVHVAISLGASGIVHAVEVNGCVAVNDLAGDSGLERALLRRVVGARRLRSV